MSRHAARRADEQRWERQQRNERAFLFGPDDRCVGEVVLARWELAIARGNGNVARAAGLCGLAVPPGTGALWGRSPQHAIDTYRRWRKRRRKR